MRPIPAAAAVAVILLSLPGASQAPVDHGANIPLADWTAMAMGHTLTYRINGEFWAMEHYYPGTDRVTLQLYDGSCMQGTWDYADPLYCFHWEGQEPSCFRHVKVGDEIKIIESKDGTDTPLTQSMTSVSDIPLTCGPAVVS